MFLVASVYVSAQTSNAENLFKEARSREAALRHEIDTRRAGSPATPLLERARTLVGAYDDIARLFPRNTYADDALWAGALLSADAFWEFGQAADRTTSLRLFRALTTRYPTSALVRQVEAQTDRLTAAKPTPERALATTLPPAPTTPTAPSVPPAAAREPKQPTVMLTAIRREVLPGALRVTLELEGEAVFHDEQIDGPPRVFIDLQGTRPVETLKDVTQAFPDDMVRQIRVGRQLGTRTRVVLDLSDAGARTVYALYNPYRVVIDFARPAPTTINAIAPTTASAIAPTSAAPIAPTTAGAVAPATAAPIAPTSAVPIAPTTAGAVAPTSAVLIAPTTAGPIAPTTAAPLAPASASVIAPASAAPIAPPENAITPQPNAKGGFSLSRQLGLGISRIVIDPGHGGHDPGAMNSGLSEANLVLDVAMRLEKLLKKQPGVEVVMTRRSDVFIPLEERTAMANREGADLFLSIHVNASEDDRARGIETYFLNFAPNPAAEAVAARENAASARTMRQLPDIVKAIALNNKIDESRDFASLVQSSMMDRLKRANRNARDLGVKQAPFMVLVGATMPSILAEISFLTNRQEATLLRGTTYRQQIAEALFNGLMRYQKSLKAVSRTVASQ